MKIFYRKWAQRIALASLLALSMGAAQAQDVQFSQFYASSLYLNPALAGLESEVTFNSNFRSQWRTASSPYLSNQVSGIMPFYAGIDRRYQIGAAGLSLINDQAGDGSLRTLGVNLTLAYTTAFVNELHRISFALQGGFVQRTIDFNNLQWGEQFSPIRGFDPTVAVGLPAGVNNKATYPLINAGAVWSYNPTRNYYRTGTSAYSGVAVSNLNQPNETFYNSGGDSKRPLLFKYHGGIEFNVSDKVNVSPNLLYVYQGPFNQLNVGAYVSYKIVENQYGTFGNTDLILGGWYRMEDAAIVSIGLSNPAWTAGFSYDANQGRITDFGPTRGAYELSFAIRSIKDMKKRRRFDTPRI